MFVSTVSYKPVWEFPKIYNLVAVRDQDELVDFEVKWSKMCQGQMRLYVVKNTGL